MTNAFWSAGIDRRDAASLTMGAEKTAPPGEGSIPIIAGMDAMMNRASGKTSDRLSTIRFRVPVERRIFSMIMVKMRVAVISSALGEASATQAPARKSSGGVR